MNFLKNICAIIALALLCTFYTYGQAPTLGTAGNFAVFTSVGAFHNTGVSTLTGDIGTNAGVLDGFPPGIVVGNIHIIDPVTVLASIDLGMAYADLASRTCSNVIGVTLGNDQILTPGVYCTGAASTLNGNLTLNGADDPSAIFIFQIDGAFATTVNSTITLINGANACNIYWQINGAFALLDNSVFKGNVLITGAISLHTNSNLEGRALTTAGEVLTEAVTVCTHSLPPVVTCPAGVSVSCAGDVPAPDTSSVIATELCGSGTTVSFVNDVITDGDCANNFSILRTYSASDICGNSATCSQTITVNDVTPPTITCPAPITIACISDLPEPDITEVDATDNCAGEVNISASPDSTGTITDPDNYNIYRKYTATDACGNTATCTQIISVISTSVLSITCPPNVSVTCTTEVPPADISTVIATGPCGAQVTITFSPDVISDQSCANQYTITRTYTATDATGDAVSCDQTIIVNDVTPPTITCPAPITIACISDLPEPDITLVDATDNCAGEVNISASPDSTGTITDPDNYNIYRKYTATDACGNTATCTQIISVISTSVLSITCPPNVSVTCTTEVPPADISTVIATGPCGAQVTITFSPDVISDQSCANQYTITRTYTATDATGDAVSCDQTIIVNDVTPPEITCPDDITVVCASEIPAPDVNNISATDNCGGTVVITVGQDNITDIIDDYNYTVLRTYIATDTCGNVATCIQSIVVTGGSEFSITCPADISLACAQDVPAPDLSMVTINGSCNGEITVSVSPDVISNLFCANNYIITRTYTATDATGFSISCSQIITVADTISPQITCPATVSVSCRLDVPAPNTASVTTSDNCAGTVTVTVAPDVEVSLGCANNYQITRTYTATDVCGNSATCTQIINVADNISPQITCPPTVNVSCRLDVPAANTNSVITSDNCVGTVIVTVAPDVEVNLGCANNYQITRTYTATDVCGNSATCTQIINVADDISPQITCPPTVNVSCRLDVPDANTNSVITSDNCVGTVIVTVAPDVEINLGCTNRYQITRTYTATDVCGNSASCTQIINVYDDVSPVLSVPPAIADISCSDDLPIQVMLTATDNCSDATVIPSVDQYTANLCEGYAITYRWTASDVCGNTSEVTRTFHVLPDITAPVITPLNPTFINGKVTINCQNSNPNWNPFPYSESDVSAQDACSEEVNVVYSKELIAIGECGIDDFISKWLLKWTATDQCGNASTYTVTLKIVDVTAPVFIDLPPAYLTVDCDNIPPAVVLTAEDECGEPFVTMKETILTGDCPGNYSIIRVYKARTRDCDYANYFTQTILVQDTTPPVITYNNYLGKQYKNGDTINIDCNYLSELQLDNTNVTVTDICSSASAHLDMTYNYVDNCAEKGFLYIVNAVWTAKDKCGNVGQLTLNFKVSDRTPPVLSHIPADMCVQVLPVVDANITASDNCSSVLVSFHETAPVLCEVNKYVVVRTWTATDECGNTSQESQHILINNNNIGPKITLDIPGFENAADSSNITINAVSGTPLGIPVITEENIIGLNSCLSENKFQINTTVLKTGVCQIDGFLSKIRLDVRVTDLCGNTSTLTYFITVIDNTAPELTAPSPISMNCGDTIPAPLVIDNSNQAVALTFHDQESIFIGCINNNPLERQWTATDVCGNKSTFLQIINIKDTEGPVLYGIPEDACSFVSKPAVVTAKDACSGREFPVTFTEKAVSSDCGQVLLRTWTATDDCGNISTGTQKIFNNDNIAPVIIITHPDLIVLRDGGVFELACDPKRSTDMLSYYGVNAVRAVDNCGGNVRLTLKTHLLEEGNCIVNGFMAKYLYTWTATDPCGNESILNLTGIFIDTTAPVFEKVPQNLILYCNDAFPAFEDLIATDCHLDKITKKEILIQSDANGSVYHREWTATDKCGNVSVATQEIKVLTTGLECNINLPAGPIDCGSADLLITSSLIGGQGPFKYEWKLVNCDGYISGGQGTDRITVVLGYTTMNIKLIVTDKNGCVSICTISLACIVNSALIDPSIVNNGYLAIDMTAEKNYAPMSVYPNPVKDKFTLSVPEFVHTDFAVQVIDILGNVVAKFNVNKMPEGGIEIDLSNQVDGLYLVNILKQGHEPLMQKVVKTQN